MFIFNDTLTIFLSIAAPIIGGISATIAILRWKEHNRNKRNNSKDFKNMIKELKEQREIAFDSASLSIQEKMNRPKHKLETAKALSKIDGLLKDIKSFLHNATKLDGRINTRNKILKLIDESMSEASILKTERVRKQVKILIKDIKHNKNSFVKLDEIIKDLLLIKTAE